MANTEAGQSRLTESLTTLSLSTPAAPESGGLAGSTDGSKEDNGPTSESASASAQDARTAALAFLQSCLARQLRCTMSDGRVLVGTFACTDRDANVILGGCLEYASLAEAETGGPEEEAYCGGGGGGRSLGLAMIPGDRLVRLEILVPPPPPPRVSAGDDCGHEEEVDEATRQRQRQQCPTPEETPMMSSS